MSSKHTILAALKQSAVVTAPKPLINIEPISVSGLNESNELSLVEQFATNLSTVAGKLITQGGKSALAEHIQSLIEQDKSVLSFVAGVTGNRQSPDRAHEMHDVDFTVLEGQVAVAENGAIWVTLPEQHRVTPFICENLIITIKRDTIVANMHQAMKAIDFNACEFGVFIAGPSKTADIEQALVVGAHGACSLDVYLI
ncbi:lactate utilization protein B/C [Shewanella maritima]|uniref:Lactate utilization protein B/C n=1 Tax=Shewanella maritima TaxID=2520507 RepID=A0A411PE90_9GAMM|nr:LUD domain-containing protein [Shewanella maritima]QBF81782.1 lactate utilization protein B/C [Shewanella maritima]